MMAPIFPSSLIESIKAAPDVPAFELHSRTVTRRETSDLIARHVGGLSAAAAAAGLSPPYSIALATGVTPEGFAVQIAAHVLGLRVVAVKPGLPAVQLAHFLTGVSVLVVDETASAELLAHASGTLTLLRVADLLGDPVTLTPRGRAEDVGLVIYTSGSSGVPKGTEYTYGALTATWAWQRDVWDADTVRLARCYGRFLLFGTLASLVMWRHLGLCLISGGTAVIPEGMPVMPQVLAERRISAVLFTVPRLCHVLDVLRGGEPVDLTALRCAMVAGSPLPARRLREALQRLGDAFHHAYGTTECGMLSVLTAADAASFSRTADDTTGFLSSPVGRRFTGVEIEVRDASGAAISPPDAIGHVWARGPGMFRGYTGGDTVATRDEDGWISTQDLGRIDARTGLLSLAGRARDVVIVNAVVHYAAAIESALTTHPDVDCAYVVGVPDERTGEAVCAFVVASEASGAPWSDLQGQLRATVKNLLGAGAVPANITVVDSVPILPSGKPDKQALVWKMKPVLGRDTVKEEGSEEFQAGKTAIAAR